MTGLSFFLLFGALSLFVGGLIAHELKKRRTFIDDFDGDPEFVALATGLWGAEVRTKHGRLEARAWPSSTGGKNSTPTWELRVERVALGKKTTLSLGLEGVLSALRDAVGLKDIQIGIADFDKRFTIRGADDDLIRGVLADVDTRAAITALFASDKVMSCRLDKHQQLSVCMVRRALSPIEVRDVLTRVRRLAACLDRGADAKRLPPPGERAVVVEASGVGGSTGAPVGVRSF